MEQVKFLSTLLRNERPYKKSHLSVLKAIMHDRSFGDRKIKLYGKTGWAAGNINVGWYVGYIEVNDQRLSFALNMVMNHDDQAPLRKHLTLESLKALGILETAD